MKHPSRSTTPIALGVALLASFAAPPTGSLAQAFERIEALCERGSYDEALAAGESLLRTSPLDDWRRRLELEESWFFAPLLDLADPWLDRLDFGGATANERAAAYFARGVVLHQRDLSTPPSVPDPAEEAEAAPQETARDAFERAIALAVEQGIRTDASYNVGTLALLDGEAWREQIPEVSGQAPAPVAAPPGAAAVTSEPELDPLEEARAAYLEAKELLSQRLRLDWRDADTRANVELVLRRLKELDEIERQREEQQQQDQQQDQEQQDPNQDPNQEQDQEQDQSEDQQQDQEGEDQPEDSEPQEDPQEEEPEPQDPEQEPSAEDQQQEAQPQPQEQFLTREEVQRLLDKLEAHEEEGEEMRAQMRQTQRRRTARDW